MSLSVDERAIKAKENNEEFERLVIEYRPFILGRVYNNNFGNSDDEISVALMAFFEAVKTYKKEKGGFLSYAGAVIKYRLIDHHRKKRKSELYIVKEEDASIRAFAAKQQSNIMEQAQERRLEIIDFTNELERWGISIETLAASSPRHKKSKELCGHAVNTMLNEPELKVLINKTKRLPVKQIAKKLNLSEKILERHRRYLIAAFIIHSGGYLHLIDYVSPSSFDREEKQ